VVGPEEMETLPLSDAGIGCSNGRTARGLVSIYRLWAA
jgi:hypothetical protein